jgi:hypothetical protein
MCCARDVCRDVYHDLRMREIACYVCDTCIPGGHCSSSANLFIEGSGPLPESALGIINSNSLAHSSDAQQTRPDIHTAMSMSLSSFSICKLSPLHS